MGSRLPELERSDLNDEQARVYDAIVASRGRIWGPFRTWLYSPELAERAQKLGEHLRFHTTMHPRLSELAILVTARFWDCQLEWSLHEPIARDTDLSAEVIEAVRLGQYPEFEREDEQLVYDFATELLYNRFVQDRTMSGVLDVLGDVGAVELPALVGYYSMVAMTLNAFQVPLPKEVQPTLVDCPTFR
ncbi:MAG: carboxymuconolactone decarboxylase family protein [Gemmatimonadota bacterium]